MVCLAISLQVPYGEVKLTTVLKRSSLPQRGRRPKSVLHSTKYVYDTTALVLALLLSSIDNEAESEYRDADSEINDSYVWQTA